MTCSGLLSGLQLPIGRSGLSGLVVKLSDFKFRSRELSRNHGLAKAGIPAQAFYEKVAKGHRLGFQPISSVSIPTRCVVFHTLDHVESTDIGSFELER